MRGVAQGVFCRAAGVSSVVSDATKILSKRDAAKAWFTRSRAALLFISVATAAPSSFHVRVTTALEEKEVRDLEAIREMGWDTMRVAGLPRAARYKTTLINWVNRRFMDEPDDPFLPFLLYEGIYGVGQILWKSIQAGEGQRFDADTSEVVSRLRLAVIDRHRASIGGAHLVQALTARHHDQIASLASRLSHTPAGDMARYQVEREQHEQHAKQQPPR